MGYGLLTRIVNSTYESGIHCCSQINLKICDTTKVPSWSRWSVLDAKREFSNRNLAIRYLRWTEGATNWGMRLELTAPTESPSKRRGDCLIECCHVAEKRWLFLNAIGCQSVFGSGHQCCVACLPIWEDLHDISHVGSYALSIPVNWSVWYLRFCAQVYWDCPWESNSMPALKIGGWRTTVDLTPPTSGTIGDVKLMLGQQKGA
jgi:hypothetical protein